MLAIARLPNWLVDEKYLTLATWGLVFATLLLVVASFISWMDSLSKGSQQKQRWKREDEQHKQDRHEEFERWQREDELRNAAVRQEMLGDLYSEFCSPELRRARTNFAYGLFAWSPIIRYETTGRPIQMRQQDPGTTIPGEVKIAEFFSVVEMMLKQEQIELQAVDRRFGDYVFRFVEATSLRYPEKLNNVRSLWQRLRAYRVAWKIPEPPSDDESKGNYWYYAIEQEYLPPHS